MLMSCANTGSASDPAAIRLTKNKTLRGAFADLTKSSLAGPKGKPSRLRDSQSRTSGAPGRAAAGAVLRHAPARGPVAALSAARSAAAAAASWVRYVQYGSGAAGLDRD